MFYEYIKTPIGIFMIKANQLHIVELELVTELATRINANPVTRECKMQLEQYFTNKRKVFDLPIALTGTAFQKLVWQELCKIDFGEIKTYSDIAHAIGKPLAQRAVGAANHRNLLPIIVPCHRVLGKNKSLTGFALGLDKKAWLLCHEGRKT